jgi:RNA polymerase sigma factor (sigma-70 family)
MCSHIRKAGGHGSSTEAALFRQAQAGCSESLNRLMARHEGLVYAVMRQHGSGRLPFGDAVHAGRLGLWRAILGYAPERGIAFSTYAWPSIMRHIWQAVKASSTNERLADVEVPGGAQSTTDVLSEWE